VRIGYAKLGRSMPLTLDRCGNLGGDVEMVAVVKELALRHPEDDFFLTGRNTGERPADVGLPGNVHNPWLDWGPRLSRWLSDLRRERGRDAGGLTVAEQLTIVRYLDELTLDTFAGLDQHIIWVGQHGTSNSPIPRVDDRTRLTKPQDWSLYYASFILRGINAWRDVDPLNREEVYLNADARNTHKMRDLKWPLRHPVLGQRNESKRLKHERYVEDNERSEREFHDYLEHCKRLGGEDDREAWRHYECLGFEANAAVWKSRVATSYARLEVNGLAPSTPFGDLISYDESWDRPGDLGLFINEARSIGVHPEKARRTILRDWVLPLSPYFLHGTWSKESLSELGVNISPAPWSEYYPRLHSVRCTFTTPSSGSGWATAKPWEAFAAGTVCFFHPAYDDQNHILGDAPSELRRWLRVRTPTELRLRVEALARDRTMWLHLVRAQRAHFDAALAERRYLRLVEERIYGATTA
jgi:hypothetical protein